MKSRITDNAKGQKMSLPVLIGCEESQEACKAYRERGIEAYSCDLKATRGNPEWHYQADIMEVVKRREWGLIILHPECTAMALSGNRWYGKGMPRHQERIDAIAWTIRLWELAKEQSPKVALENPLSVIFNHLDNVQWIQPHEFGHGEVKKTGLALHNLPRLVATNKVEGREERVWRMPPGPNRKRDRSATYPGIAAAFAEQWRP